MAAVDRGRLRALRKSGDSSILFSLPNMIRISSSALLATAALMLSACVTHHRHPSPVVVEPVRRVAVPTPTAYVFLHDPRSDVYFDSERRLYYYREGAEWACTPYLPGWIRFEHSHAVRVKGLPYGQIVRRERKPEKYTGEPQVYVPVLEPRPVGHDRQVARDPVISPPPRTVPEKNPKGHVVGRKRKPEKNTDEPRVYVPVLEPTPVVQDRHPAPSPPPKTRPEPAPKKEPKLPPVPPTRGWEKSKPEKNGKAHGNGKSEKKTKKDKDSPAG